MGVYIREREGGREGIDGVKEGLSYWEDTVHIFISNTIACARAAVSDYI